MLHLSAHWGDLIEQIKKSVIYTSKGTRSNILHGKESREQRHAVEGFMVAHGISHKECFDNFYTSSKTTSQVSKHIRCSAEYLN